MKNYTLSLVTVFLLWANGAHAINKVLSEDELFVDQEFLNHTLSLSLQKNDASPLQSFAASSVQLRQRERQGHKEDTPQDEKKFIEFNDKKNQSIAAPPYHQQNSKNGSKRKGDEVKEKSEKRQCIRYTADLEAENFKRVWEDDGYGSIDSSQNIPSLNISSNAASLIALAQSPDKELTSYNKQRLRLIIKGHKNVVNTAVFNHDGTQIITASNDGTACIWDAFTGTLKNTLKHEGVVNSAVFNSDGMQVVTASNDKTAKVWDAATSKLIATLSHTEPVICAIFSDDKTSIITRCTDNLKYYWSLANYQKMRITRHPVNGLKYTAHYSPDRIFIVTAIGDLDARLFPVKNIDQENKNIQHLVGHVEAVNSAYFSPDGAFVVTASSDSTVRIWKVADGTEQFMYTEHSKPVSSAQFSPDGKRIVTASHDKTVHIFPLPE